MQEIKLKNITLLFSGVSPSVKEYHSGTKRLFILGSPIYNERIEPESLKERIFNEDMAKCVSGVNGSFLFILYNTETNILSVANVRFSSIGFYYRQDKGSFIGATNYADIWNRFRDQKGFKINEEAFYEFLYMRRLHGDKTYDKNTRFLNSASILKYDPINNNMDIAKYWRPSYKSNGLSEEDNAHKLAALIKQSFNRMTSDSKRYGLLLSGGLDSRSILSASNKPLTCFTTCEYENNEFSVARELSKVKDYEHIFIKKPKDYYSGIIEKAVYTSAAMGLYVNAHFFNIEEETKKRADVLLHGYGFDFLFRGKYLPNTMSPIMKKITYKRNLIPIGAHDKSVTEEFIDTMSYKLKSIYPPLLSNYRSRKNTVDSLYHSIKEIIDEAKDLSDDPYMWWNYCCFHNLSRHYTYLNIQSIRAFMEERTISFDNDLFDLFWSLEPSMLLNGNIFLRAIAILDPAIFKVRYSNTNLHLGDPALLTSAKIVLNKVLKETRLNRVFKGALPPPTTKERSWPIDSDLIISNDRIKDLSLRLCKGNELDELSFLDMDTVTRCVKNHLNRSEDHTNLILSLITLKEFLNKDEYTGSKQ